MNRQLATRLAAPAAFLAGITIAVLLVRAGLNDGETTTAAQTSVATTAPATTTAATTATEPKPVFVEVESGGTLDQIALDNDTTVEQLLQLNPGLDPPALQVGQRIRVGSLRRRWDARSPPSPPRSSSSLRRAPGPTPVVAKAYFVENGATGEVLAREHPNTRVPIASITKLMTVLVALDAADVDDVVVVAGPGAARSASRRSTCASASGSPSAISSRPRSSRAPTTLRGRSRRTSARAT